MELSSKDIENKNISKNRLLMIAYHFPPIQGSSGVHRTVQFARQLPSFGWAPIVVAPHQRAYPAIGDDSWAKLPEEAIVRRAFALDSARHLSVKGKYLGVTAIPDRWISWWPAGVFECLRLVRKYKPQVIWSTYPIATAHLIGLTVSRLTGIPWVADFRDPMVQEGQPSSRLNRLAHQVLERKIIQHASRCVFVSQSALDDYAQRYPTNDALNWKVIENGYDESLFEPYGHLLTGAPKRAVGQPIRMLHSGLLYSSGRNPLPFLQAVKALVDHRGIEIEVVFRACGNETEVGGYIQQLGLSHVVKLLPSISYDSAIREMIESDVLLVFQGAVFNKQIPAKLYEYIRAGRPILAMTDVVGETARMLRDWDGVYISDIESSAVIERSVLDLVYNLGAGKLLSRNPDVVKSLSRYAGAGKLKDVLEGVAMPVRMGQLFQTDI
ncbi:MAG: glycosyltransferase [Candidatus Vecturithrix sp.]|jgi:hypothetical protein|nr:glycosyltransferase [Candidatus Vecturithrix sp.]